MTAPAATFLVIEDGREYIDRFTRLLGADFRFRFLRAGHAAEARALLAADAVAGLLLDLDFRRTPVQHLVDDDGHCGLSDHDRPRVAGVQGILIARALRRAGVTLPALLFADLEDPEQISFLQTDLAPLRVVPSSVGLQEIARLLGGMAGARP